jgi:predicted O-methyltransferase YrrM
MALDLASPNTERRDALVGRLFQSAIDTAELLSINVGDRLGLYAALDGAGGLTAAELGTRAGTAERYTREWLEQQAVAGILEVDDPAAAPDRRRYSLPAEYHDIFIDQDSPVHLAPFAEMLALLARHVPDVVDAFRSGGGIAYDQFGLDGRRVQERVNRPLYTTLLPHVWLPEIADVHARLQADSPARVADIGCGAGLASIAIAQAYPNVRVDGFDNDAASIQMARANAAAAGVADRVQFNVRDCSDPALTGDYDLVAAFVMLHDVARPVETLRAMRQLAGAHGTVIVLDMRVGDSFVAPGPLTDRMAYAMSLLYCLPLSLADEPSVGTGTVMRVETFQTYARAAGFRDVQLLPIEHDFFRFFRLN